MNFLNFINPVSRHFHSLQDFSSSNGLSKRQRCAAIAAAVFGSIIPVFGTTAAFRAVVQHYALAFDGEKLSFFKEKFQFDGFTEKMQHTLYRKLYNVGIHSAEDLQIEKVYVAYYSSSSGNNFFGAEGWVRKENRARTNNDLCVLLPSVKEYEHAKRKGFGLKNHFILPTKAFHLGRSLPEEFIRIMKEGYSQ